MKTRDSASELPELRRSREMRRRTGWEVIAVRAQPPTRSGRARAPCAYGSDLREAEERARPRAESAGNRKLDNDGRRRDGPDAGDGADRRAPGEENGGGANRRSRVVAAFLADTTRRSCGGCSKNCHACDPEPQLKQAIVVATGVRLSPRHRPNTVNRRSASADATPAGKVVPSPSTPHSSNRSQSSACSPSTARSAARRRATVAPFRDPRTVQQQIRSHRPGEQDRRRHGMTAATSTPPAMPAHLPDCPTER
jgi:hypothetical protein